MLMMFTSGWNGSWWSLIVQEHFADVIGHKYLGNFEIWNVVPWCPVVYGYYNGHFLRGEYSLIILSCWFD
jgi:hypothetical protein